MDSKLREEIIKRQDEKSKSLSEKFEKSRKARTIFTSVIKDIDEGFISELFGAPEKRSDCAKIISDLHSKNPEDYNEKVKILNEKYPQLKSEEFKKAFSDWEKAQFDYFSEFIDYLNMMDDDYKNLFSSEYKKKTFELAKNGYFLFYEQTPDFEPLLTDKVEENVKTVSSFFSSRNWIMLINTFSNWLEDNPDDWLRTVKTNDLREALFCLVNGCYSSCTRTMLALIENEHENASNINADLLKPIITTGKERSIQISEQLKDVRINYFSECWKLMDDYYREITISVKNKSKRFINRNEVVHGVYWDAILPSRDSCLQLVLFYISFKTISFYLQSIYDMKEMVSEYLVIFNGLKLSNKTIK